MSEIGRFPATELPPGAMKKLRRPPFDVLVANVRGVFHAIEDACPHSGWSLCDGDLEGAIVTCAGHGWQIDVRDGAVLTEAGSGERNPVFRCEERDGWIVVSE